VTLTSAHKQKSQHKAGFFVWNYWLVY